MRELPSRHYSGHRKAEEKESNPVTSRKGIWSKKCGQLAVIKSAGMRFGHLFGVPLPEIAILPPKVVVPPPGNVFTIHTVFFESVDSGENH